MTFKSTLQQMMSLAKTRQRELDQCRATFKSVVAACEPTINNYLRVKNEWMAYLQMLGFDEDDIQWGTAKSNEVKGTSANKSVGKIKRKRGRPRNGEEVGAKAKKRLAEILVECQSSILDVFKISIRFLAKEAECSPTFVCKSTVWQAIKDLQKERREEGYDATIRYCLNRVQQNNQDENETATETLADE